MPRTCVQQCVHCLLLKKNTVLIHCCDASWEIIFVSTDFGVIYWDCPNSREVIFYSAFKDPSSQNISKAVIFSKYIQKNTWVFPQFKLHLWMYYNMGGIINKLWLKATRFISLMSKSIFKSIFIFWELSTTNFRTSNISIDGTL